MESERGMVRFAGAMFLIAMVASLAGGSMIEATLGSVDSPAGLSRSPQLVIGVILELVNAFAVLGIGISLLPSLRRHNELLGLAYASLRGMEAAFFIIGALAPLALAAVNAAMRGAAAQDASALHAAGALAMAARAQVAGLLTPLYVGLSSPLLYWSMYRTRRLPRYITVWGLVAVALMLALNIARFDTGAAMLLALPIIANEIYMGVYMIVKGLRPPATSATS